MKKLTKNQKQKIMLETLEGGPSKVWTCKIGYAFSGELPKGASASNA